MYIPELVFVWYMHLGKPVGSLESTVKQVKLQNCISKAEVVGASDSFVVLKYYVV